MLSERDFSVTNPFGYRRHIGFMASIRGTLKWQEMQTLDCKPTMEATEIIAMPANQHRLF